MLYKQEYFDQIYHMLFDEFSSKYDDNQYIDETFDISYIGPFKDGNLSWFRTYKNDLLKYCNPQKTTFRERVDFLKNVYYNIFIPLLNTKTRQFIDININLSKQAIEKYFNSNNTYNEFLNQLDEKTNIEYLITYSIFDSSDKFQKGISYSDNTTDVCIFCKQNPSQRKYYTKLISFACCDNKKFICQRCLAGWIQMRQSCDPRLPYSVFTSCPCCNHGYDDIHF